MSARKLSGLLTLLALMSLGAMLSAEPGRAAAATSSLRIVNVMFNWSCESDEPGQTCFYVHATDDQHGVTVNFKGIVAGPGERHVRNSDLRLTACGDASSTVQVHLEDHPEVTTAIDLSYCADRGGGDWWSARSSTGVNIRHKDGLNTSAQWGPSFPAPPIPAPPDPGRSATLEADGRRLCAGAVANAAAFLDDNGNGVIDGADYAGLRSDLAFPAEFGFDGPIGTLVSGRRFGADSSRNLQANLIVAADAAPCENSSGVVVAAHIAIWEQNGQLLHELERVVLIDRGEQLLYLGDTIRIMGLRRQGTQILGQVSGTLLGFNALGTGILYPAEFRFTFELPMELR